MESLLVRFGLARSASAFAALGLTAAAVTVALGSPVSSASNGAGGAGSPVVLGLVGGSVVIKDARANRANRRSADAVELAHSDLELATLSPLAAERDLAGEQATEASALLETMKAARAGAAEQATRAAERERLASLPPRELGQIMAADRGFTGDQWSCLDSLWQRESNWNPHAQNRSSGAYGIPQSLPGSKMATVAADWATNPATQITWGLNYIVARYGTPCGAWGHSQGYGWY